MDENLRNIRQGWASAIKNRGLSQTAAILLQAIKPLSYFSAQLVYAGKPIMSHFLPDQQIEAAGGLLDNSSEFDHFIAMLRTEV